MHILEQFWKDDIVCVSPTIDTQGGSLFAAWHFWCQELIWVMTSPQAKYSICYPVLSFRLLLFVLYSLAFNSFLSFLPLHNLNHSNINFFHKRMRRNCKCTLNVHRPECGSTRATGLSEKRWWWWWTFDEDEVTTTNFRTFRWWWIIECCTTPPAYLYSTSRWTQHFDRTFLFTASFTSSNFSSFLHSSSWVGCSSSAS